MKHQIGKSGSVGIGTSLTCVDCVEFVLHTWIGGFSKSPFYRNQSDFDMVVSADIIGNFTDIMFEKIRFDPAPVV